MPSPGKFELGRLKLLSIALASLRECTWADIQNLVSITADFSRLLVELRCWTVADLFENNGLNLFMLQPGVVTSSNWRTIVNGNTSSSIAGLLMAKAQPRLLESSDVICGGEDDGLQNLIIGRVRCSAHDFTRMGELGELFIVEVAWLQKITLATFPRDFHVKRLEVLRIRDVQRDSGICEQIVSLDAPLLKSIFVGSRQYSMSNSVWLLAGWRRRLHIMWPSDSEEDGQLVRKLIDYYQEIAISKMTLRLGSSNDNIGTLEVTRALAIGQLIELLAPIFRSEVDVTMLFDNGYVGSLSVHSRFTSLNHPFAVPTPAADCPPELLCKLHSLHIVGDGRLCHDVVCLLSHKKLHSLKLEFCEGNNFYCETSVHLPSLSSLSIVVPDYGMIYSILPWIAAENVRNVIIRSQNPAVAWDYERTRFYEELHQEVSHFYPSAVINCDIDIKGNKSWCYR